MEAYHKEAKDRFPSIQSTNLIIYFLTTPPTQEDMEVFFSDKFNHENDYVKKVNEDAKKELVETFKEDSADSELIKFLKEIARDENQKMGLEVAVDNPQMGVAGIFFLLDTLREFYLGKLPSYLDEKLNQSEPVKFEELDKEKLKLLLSNLDDSQGTMGVLPNLYSTFTQVEVESDLDQLRASVDTNLKQLETLINDVRKSKKPTELEKPAQNEELNKTKAELDK
jgi:hypothetical protein